MIFSDFLRFCI